MFIIYIYFSSIILWYWALFSWCDNLMLYISIQISCNQPFYKFVRYLHISIYKFHAISHFTNLFVICIYQYTNFMQSAILQICSLFAYINIKISCNQPFYKFVCHLHISIHKFHAISHFTNLFVICIYQYTNFMQSAILQICSSFAYINIQISCNQPFYKFVCYLHISIYKFHAISHFTNLFVLFQCFSLMRELPVFVVGIQEMQKETNFYLLVSMKSKLQRIWKHLDSSNR